MKYLWFLIIILIFNIQNVYSEVIIIINHSDPIFINNQYVGEGPMVIKGLKPGNHRIKIGLRRYNIISPNSFTIEKIIGNQSPNINKLYARRVPQDTGAAGKRREHRRKDERRNRNKGLTGIAAFNQLLPGKYQKKINKGLAMGAVLNNIFK